MKRMTICQTKNGAIILSVGAVRSSKYELEKLQEMAHSFNTVRDAVKHIRDQLTKWKQETKLT